MIRLLWTVFKIYCGLLTVYQRCILWLFEIEHRLHPLCGKLARYIKRLESKKEEKIGGR